VFRSLERSWHAELDIVQYTRPNARLIEEDTPRGPWYSWDHTLRSADEVYPISYTGARHRIEVQSDTYFHFSRLECPWNANEVYVCWSPRNTMGIYASTRFLQGPYDDRKLGVINNPSGQLTQEAIDHRWSASVYESRKTKAIGRKSGHFGRWLPNLSPLANPSSE
jgi:hypothetical protein